MGETGGSACVTFADSARQKAAAHEHHPVPHPLRAGLWPLLCTLALGCAAGAVRQTSVSPLALYGDVRAVRVVAAEPGSTMAAELVAGARVGLPRSGWRLAKAGEPAYTLELAIAEAQTPVSAEVSLKDQLLGGLATLGGFRDADRGLLAVEATLRDPDGTATLGASRWQAVGAPTSLAGTAGMDLGQALGKAMHVQEAEWYPRRGADERLFFTPTARTVPDGAFVLSDDEALLLRVAYGVTRRLQLDLWLGGLPVPAFGGGAVPLPGAIVAGGGAGLALFGLFDLGVKYVALEETRTLPGIAVSYDMLDAFGSAIGGGGGVGIGGSGLGGAGFVGTAGSNAQFNLFTLTAGKHFSTGTQITLGGWLLDNHNFLPQSASFVAACGVAGSNGVSGGAAMTKCSGATELPRLPLQFQAFLGLEQAFNAHWSAAVELLPRYPVSNTMWTTGVRWLPGSDAPAGFIALDRIKARIDLALAWIILDANPAVGRQNATPVYFPWIGVGLYVW